MFETLSWSFSNPILRSLLVPSIPDLLGCTPAGWLIWRRYYRKFLNKSIGNSCNMTGRGRKRDVLRSFSYDREQTDTPAKPGIFTKTRRPKKEKGVAEPEVFSGPSLFEIRISKEYMSLFGDDLRIHHAPDLIRDLVQIGDGMIASVVSFFLAHKEKCRYKIRRVLESIGAIEEGMTKGTVSKIMAKPEKFKAEIENFGICVDGECLVYERNKRIFFTNPPPPPPKTSPGAVIDAEHGPEPASHRTALEATPEAMVSPEPPEN